MMMGSLFDMPQPQKWVPEEEGVTHINAFSQSRTELGRFLSNFTHHPFQCEDGWFSSVEAYWYWLLIPPEDPERDEIRPLWGNNAKMFGRQHKAKDWGDSAEFREKIKKALDIKVKTAPFSIRCLLHSNTLPIVHYYVYGGAAVPPRHGQWVWDHLNQFDKSIL